MSALYEIWMLTQVGIFTASFVGLTISAYWPPKH